MFVAPPVGAGDVQQLYRFDVRRAVHVRPLAQVNKLPVPVNAERRLIGQVADNLQLVGLVGEEFYRLVPADLFPHKGLAGPNGLPHQPFNALQVFRGEGSGHVEVVVEAVLGGRPDSHFGFREDAQHCVGHYVGRRVAHPVPQGLSGIHVRVVNSSMVQHKVVLH